MRKIVLAFVLLLAITDPVAAAGGDALPAVVQSVKPTRLLIPRLGVDAPVVELGIKVDGTMDSPAGPDPVAWYDFSPTPGNAGNAVFAGHRDWRTGVTGVFWGLSDLSKGDTISVVLADGRQLSYLVDVSVLIGSDNAIPIEDIVGQTADEAITLITCEGSFDPSSHDYDKRRVIRAGRLTG